MLNSIALLFNDAPRGQVGKLAGIYALLIGFNVLAWAWALMAFGDRPALVGTAVLAYVFGLRHAVDADHIAAIDNVVRKLMQDGKRPHTVGFFFSLGHSTVVVVATLAIALTATAFETRFAALKNVGGVLGTSVSAAFLIAIALINLVILRGVWASFRHVRAGGRIEAHHADMLAGDGVLARLFAPLFRVVTRSWHMYPLGFLFGLGFDTATEVALLGISAHEAAQGMSPLTILVFPALFTAGMALVDTTDGVFMVGAYGWAFVNPMRKLWYNLTITAVSVLVALLIGGLEALGLIAGKLNLGGTFWSLVGTLNDDLASFGFVVIGLFVVSWIVSAMVYRLIGFEELTVDSAKRVRADL